MSRSAGSIRSCATTSSRGSLSCRATTGRAPSSSRRTTSTRAAGPPAPGARLLAPESADALGGRFRRIEVVGDIVAARVPAATPEGWLEIRRPAENVLQLLHSAYSGGATESGLAAMFPSSGVSARALSLREIFLVLARQQQTGAGREAA